MGSAVATFNIPIYNKQNGETAATLANRFTYRLTKFEKKSCRGMNLLPQD